MVHEKHIKQSPKLPPPDTELFTSQGSDMVPNLTNKDLHDTNWRRTPASLVKQERSLGGEAWTSLDPGAFRGKTDYKSQHILP